MSDETTSTTESDLERFPAAYAQMLDEIRAVPDDELAAINIDIRGAVITTMGVLPEIRKLRADIAATIPTFDLVQFDKLETYALAAGHANPLYRAASDTAESLQALSDAGTKLRELLLGDASALAHRGRIDGTRLKELQGLMQPRWTMSFMKGPMTSSELRLARKQAEAAASCPSERCVRNSYDE